MLPIFPSSGLSHSVITIVWIGIAVVAYFNLRLGWPLAGLIIPGYLVPLLIAKPWAGSVTILEGVITYLIVWLFSSKLSRLGLWSSVFGRDRFFMLLLVSVLVRAACDSWLLPRVGELLMTRWGIVFDYYSLQSFGLIIVALIGNQFWKTGLVRGLAQLAIVLVITWAIVRFLLMRHTNFSLAQLEYMYEDIATSFLASPKSYIILIFAAFVASRMNILYGWDYHGILVPSLLALVWHVPTKVLLTLFEALVILWLSRLVLALPLFANSSIENARKVLLFFNIGFAYKLALSFALMKWEPTLKASDAFGYGYLLSTLLAIRMHDDGIAARVTRVTLQCSLVAALLANLLGFGLTFVPRTWAITVADQGPVPAPVRESMRLSDLMRRDKVAMVARRTPDSMKLPVPGELEIFAAGIEKLQRHVGTGSAEPLRAARELLWGIQYRIDEIQDRWLYVREVNPERGWGSFVLDRRAAAGLVIEVPGAADEWIAMDAGVVLFELLKGSWLALAGCPRATNTNGTSDVLQNERSIFQTFHRVVARRNVLQVRGHTPETVRRSSGHQLAPSDADAPDAQTRLWVNSALPDGLDLGGLKVLGHDVAIEWEAGPGRNVQRESTWSGFGELVLSRADRRKLLVGSLLPGQTPVTEEHVERIEGFLTKWLLDTRGEIAEPGTDLYVVPQRDQLLYLEDNLLAPLFRLVREDRKQGALGEEAVADLAVLNSFAQVFGYRLSRYSQRGSRSEYIVLSERSDQPRRRYWGTYVFRVGRTRPYVVTIPRPRFEKGSFEYGVTLFEELSAEALLIAGANPRANRDGSADVVALRHRASFFNLVFQSYARMNAGRSVMFVQARGFATRAGVPPPAADALVAVGDGTTREASLTKLAAELYHKLREDQLLTKLVDGSPGTAGYEATGTAQGAYILEATRHQFAALWLAPTIRATFRGQAENELQEAQFHSLGIASAQADLFERIGALGQRAAPHGVPQELKEAVRVFVTRQDIVALASLPERWGRFHFERVLDRDSQSTFLLIQTEPGTWPAVAALRPRPGHESVSHARKAPDRPGVRDWITEHGGWLEFTP